MQRKKLLTVIILACIAMGMVLVASQLCLINLSAVPSPLSLVPRDAQLALAKTAIEIGQSVLDSILSIKE